MGLLSRLSSVASLPRLKADSAIQRYTNAFWAGDDLLASTLGAASPDMALTLSHVYCAVSTISDDFGTMTCQLFEDLGADGRRRIGYRDAGIGTLAYQLRWAPNRWQTAKAFWSTMAWQYQLRPAAYAELMYRPDGQGFLDQLIPRHPDRVRQEVLPDGTIRFRLLERNGNSRNVPSDEMFVVRNTSMDGLNALSRLDYGGQALSSALALQEFTKNYFRKGATAALLATYKGAVMEPEDETTLHGSMTRYLSGPDNAGGLLLVPEDIDVKALGVDPEKAQLLGLKNISGRDVARMFKMPPSWLGIEGAQSYNSQVQDAANYINRCQMPMVVEFEQAIQRDLILVATRFFAKFNMDYLLRAATKERMEAYEIAIRSRVMRPSEARVKEDMSPDPELDRLSEGDFRPGAARTANGTLSESPARALASRTHLKAILCLHDNAVRCLRRERAAVEKLAKKHAGEVEPWRAGLKDFYEEHAGFVAQTMRIPITRARDYAAQHGSQLERRGIVLFDEHWEREEADALCEVALCEDEPIAA